MEVLRYPSPFTSLEIEQPGGRTVLSARRLLMLSVANTSSTLKRKLNVTGMPGLVREALERERRRGGRSFVVVPRIADLEPMHEHLRALVPDFDIVTAHGRMKAEALDEAVLAFADGNRLPLDPEQVDRAAAFRERELVVGIRPEHFVTGDASAPRLRCRVQVVEPLGADTLLELGLGEAAITARVPPQVRPQPGSTLEIGVDPRRLHLFDPESERTLH